MKRQSWLGRTLHAFSQASNGLARPSFCQVAEVDPADIRAPDLARANILADHDTIGRAGQPVSPADVCAPGGVIGDVDSGYLAES